MTQDPTIVVAGAQGFVGRAVVRALSGRGISVMALNRPRFDLLAPAGWDIPEGAHAVVLAAGIMEGSPEAMMAVNADAAGRFAAHCRERKVGKMVFLSSGAVYGNVDGPTSPSLSPAPTSPYGRSKHQGEMAVAAAWDGGPLAVLRLYFPYGAGQKSPRLVPRMRERIAAGEEIVCRPDGGPLLTLTHVDDMAAIIVEDFLLGSHSGTWNLASDQCIGIAELASVLAASEGREARLSRTGDGGDSVSAPYPWCSAWRRLETSLGVGT